MKYVRCVGKTGTPDPRITPLREIYEASDYRSLWPTDGFIVRTHFTEKLQTFYASLEEKSVAPTLLVHVQDATIVGNVLYVPSDGTDAVVWETHRPNDREATVLVPESIRSIARPARFVDPTTDYFYLGSAGSSNYGHWLVDDLPRVKAMIEHRELIPGRKMLVVIPSYSAKINQVRRDTLRRLLGRETRIIPVDPAYPLYFPRLHYVTPVSDHPIAKHPAAIAFAAALSRRFSSAAVRTKPRHLFVRRGESIGRRLINTVEVEALLTARGFTAIDPAALTFDQQATLFAGAESVVGIMGAAMTNVLFSSAETHVIQLAPEGWIEPFYWDLSAILGHRYQALYGLAVDTTSPHKSDFSVDLQALASVL